MDASRTDAPRKAGGDGKEKKRRAVHCGRRGRRLADDPAPGLNPPVPKAVSFGQGRPEDHIRIVGPQGDGALFIQGGQARGQTDGGHRGADHVRALEAGGVGQHLAQVLDREPVAVGEDDRQARRGQKRRQGPGRGAPFGLGGHQEIGFAPEVCGGLPSGGLAQSPGPGTQADHGFSIAGQAFFDEAALLGETLRGHVDSENVRPAQGRGVLTPTSGRDGAAESCGQIVLAEDHDLGGRGQGRKGQDVVGDEDVGAKGPLGGPGGPGRRGIEQDGGLGGVHGQGHGLGVDDIGVGVGGGPQGLAVTAAPQGGDGHGGAQAVVLGKAQKPRGEQHRSRDAAAHAAHAHAGNVRDMGCGQTTRKTHAQPVEPGWRHKQRGDQASYDVRGGHGRHKDREGRPGGPPGRWSVRISPGWSRKA
jgi:hypothetical protein